MTRINTNVISLSAQNTLAKSNNQLTETLTRLSTGLRINTGKDDPAGLIAATSLGNDIKSTQQAIANSQVANQMISTADSALGQINTLLTSVRGLVTQAANTGAMSSAQIAANQLQIDSSLDAINRISQTTKFQGQNLLDGSLGFLTAGTSTNYATTMRDLQVNQVNMGTAASVAVDVKVTTAATQAVISDSLASGSVAKSTFTLGSGSMTIDAPIGGIEYNNTSLQIQQSASVAAGTAVAAYDSSTDVLTVTVNNTGTTANTVIAAAIAADTNFKIDTTTPTTGTYTAATSGVSSLSKRSITTTDGGVIQVNAKDPNSSWDGTAIKFDMTGTSATPSVTWAGSPGSGTLTIKVSSSGTTTLAAIANAINTSDDTNVKKLAASVTTAGNVNPAFDANGATSGTTSAATYKVGLASIAITANATGLAANDLMVRVTVGGGSTTAVYNGAGNGGKGLLTVNLQASTTITAATINTALNAGLTGDVVAFQNKFTAAATLGDVTTGAATITKVAGTGSNETATGLDATTAEVVENTVTDGTSVMKLTMTATGTHTADAGAKLIINEAASGVTATTATYDNTSGTGGASGTLTITLGQGQTINAAAITAAINGMSAPSKAVFDARYTLATTYDVGTSIQTAVTTLADQVTVGGTNDIKALGNTLTGGGISASFAGGTGTSSLSGDLVMQLGGNAGSQVFTFISGTTADQMKVAINQASDSTGVGASLNATTGALQLTATGYGSSQFVNVNIVKDLGTFAANLSATHAAGTDIAATVNNIAATGVGNTVSINTPSLAFNATLADGATAGTEVTFDINGGGALFQLGAQVVSSQQARLGIQSVDSANLGGISGRLYELGSGKDASLATNTRLAAKIVTAAADQVSAIRGRLGAFQKATVDTNISSLTDAVTNLTAAQSSIQDADFAAESSNLTRAQILVQSGTSVLGIANKNPENVLSLLR